MKKTQTFNAETGFYGSVHISDIKDFNVPISIHAYKCKFLVDFSKFTNVKKIYLDRITVDLGSGLMPKKCEDLTFWDCHIHVSSVQELTVESLFVNTVHIHDKEAFRKSFKHVRFYYDEHRYTPNFDIIPLRVQYIISEVPGRVWVFQGLLKRRPMLRAMTIIIHSFYEMNLLFSLASMYRSISYEQGWDAMTSIQLVPREIPSNKTLFQVNEKDNKFNLDLVKFKTNPRECIKDYFIERHNRLLYGTIQNTVETQCHTNKLSDPMSLVRQFVGEPDFTDWAD